MPSCSFINEICFTYIISVIILNYKVRILWLLTITELLGRIFFLLMADFYNDCIDSRADFT